MTTKPIHNNHRVFYLSAIIAFALMIVIRILTNYIAGITELGWNVQRLNTAIFYYVIMACSVGFMIEYYVLYKIKIFEIFNSKLFKLVASFFALPILVFTNINTHHFINSYTHLDPSLLPNAVVALNLIFMPYTCSILLMLMLTLILFYEIKKDTENVPFKVEFLFINKNQSKANKSVSNFNLNVFPRLIGIIGLILCLEKFEKSLFTKGGILNIIANTLVIESEYMKYSTCDGAKEGYLVADIGGGFVSIFDPKNNQFFRHQCLRKNWAESK